LFSTLGICPKKERGHLLSNFLKMMLHNGNNETDSSLVRAFSPWWRVLCIAYLRFSFGGGLFMAAAIAFFSLICLAPLGILLAGGL